MGGKASRVKVFDFISVPTPTITQSNSPFQGGSRCGPARPAAIFFKLFQIERLVLRIPFEAPVNRMARITNRDVAHQGMGEKIHQSRQPKGRHRQHRPAASEEVNAGGDSKNDNGQPGLAVEIFLDIKCVQTARYARGNRTGV